MYFAGPSPMVPVNLSDKKTISFWTKGDGRTYQLMLFTKRKGAMPDVKSFVSGPEWRHVEFSLPDFNTDASDLEGLMSADLSTLGRFGFQIDDVRLEP